jgi:hypothetical protein
MSGAKRSSWVPIVQDDPPWAKIEGVDDDGWFTETEAMWPGQKFALALEVRRSVSLLLIIRNIYVCIVS